MAYIHTYKTALLSYTRHATNSTRHVVHIYRMQNTVYNNNSECGTRHTAYNKEREQNAAITREPQNTTHKREHPEVRLRRERKTTHRRRRRKQEAESAEPGDQKRKVRRCEDAEMWTLCKCEGEGDGDGEDEVEGEEDACVMRGGKATEEQTTTT